MTCFRAHDSQVREDPSPLPGVEGKVAPRNQPGNDPSEPDGQHGDNAEGDNIPESHHLAACQSFERSTPEQPNEGLCVIHAPVAASFNSFGDRHQNRSDEFVGIHLGRTMSKTSCNIQRQSFIYEAGAGPECDTLLPGSRNIPSLLTELPACGGKETFVHIVTAPGRDLK